MNVLGLDLSLNSPGVAYGNRAYTVPRINNVIGVPRLQYWRDVLGDLLRDVAPEVVVIEGYSYGSVSSSALQIAELGGVVRLLLGDGFKSYAIVEPRRLKKYATGNGAAKKGANKTKDDPTVPGTVVYEALQAGADIPQRSVAGRVVYDDNAADAWWLMQMGLARYAPNNARVAAVPVLNRGALIGAWPKLKRINAK